MSRGDPRAATLRRALRPAGRTRRTVAAVLVACVVGSVPAGCTRDSPEGGDLPTPRAGSPGATTTHTQTIDPNEAYGLAVPPGVQLTPLGSNLRLGQPANVAWRPKRDTVGVLTIVVSRLRQG